MECPQCHAEVPNDASFCDECGSRIESFCPSCGESNRSTAKFCRKCGERLTTDDHGDAKETPGFQSPDAYTPKHLANKILANKVRLSGERKQVTVMFADLKGSTALISDRDPEEADKILSPIIDCMMEAVHRYEGTVTRVMGDGIMALFGAPIGHEDHALRACYSALALHESMEELMGKFRREYGLNPQIRVGLNSGQVVVREIGNDLYMEYTAMGHTAHLAARMEGLATPGATLLTEHTFRHVEGYVKLEDLGPVPVKGVTDPVHVYELTGISSLRTRMQVAQQRGLTPFVGRQNELKLLVEVMAMAGNGRGQIIGVSGEAGVGKTRLFYEFTRTSSKLGWLLLETDSHSYGKATAYLPVVGLLKSYCHIEDRDDDRTIREKVAGKLVTLDEKLMLVQPALLSLLDVDPDDTDWKKMDPPQRREQTLDAIKRLLLRESQEQPVCLVVENLHWIDSETQTLLDRLVESLPTSNLLMLVNYRPEYQHSWGNKSCHTQLRLDPLPTDSIQDLLSAVLGDSEDLGPLKNLLIEHSGGNPFFLEEIVRTLVETELLVGSAGAYSLVNPLSTIQVPDTVQAVLSARLDRLSAEDKYLLQSASVIGMEIPYKLLANIVDLPSEKLPVSLANLQATEFLYESNLFPEIEYTFRHALTQEVVYGSMLNEQRRELHARIADAIERLYADRLSEQVDRLANHTFRGGQWKRAIRYLQDLSNKAAQRSAYQEAARSLERALEALDHLPNGQNNLQLGVDIRFGLRSTLQPLGEHSRVSAYLREAEKLSLELEDQSRLGWASSYLCQYLWWERDAQRAEGMGQRALTIASKLDDLALKAATNFFLGQGYFNVGTYTRTIEQAQRNVALLTGEHAHDRLGLTGLPSVLSRIYLSWALSEQGRFSEASEIAEEAIAIAKAAGQAYSLAGAYLALGQIQTAQGVFSEAIPVLEGVAELCTTSHLPLIQQPATAVLGLAYALAGHLTEALSIVESGVPTERNIGIFDTPTSTIASGTVYLLGGKFDKAGEVADYTAQMVEQHGYRGNQAMVEKLLGDIDSQRDAPGVSKAKDHYDQALSLAEELGMRPLVAQCKLSLGLLDSVSKCPGEAKQYLTSTLKLFREMDMNHWAKRTELELEKVQYKEA